MFSASNAGPSAANFVGSSQKSFWSGVSVEGVRHCAAVGKSPESVQSPVMHHSAPAYRGSSHAMPSRSAPPSHGASFHGGSNHGGGGHGGGNHGHSSKH